MNSWFDYGFVSPQFPAQQAFGVPGVGFVHPVIQPTYALQVAPLIGAYQRQPFASPGQVGIGSATAHGVNQLTPYGAGAFGVLGGPGLSTASWPGFQEPSTLRPIGFQPPIAGAGTLPQFPQVFGRIPSDDEIENIISEALDADPAFSGNAEVEVQCESGVVTLTGSVQHKWLKRAIGELAWSAPGIVDVKNNLELSSRRRIRAGLRKESTVTPGQPRR